MSFLTIFCGEELPTSLEKKHPSQLGIAGPSEGHEERVVDLAWAQDSPGRLRFQTASAAPQGSRGQWGGAAEVRERRGNFKGFRYVSLSPTGSIPMLAGLEVHSSGRVMPLAFYCHLPGEVPIPP